MPVPSAAISVPICSDESILSKRTRSTLRIFPRSGSTAWNSRLRPCLALPPALSPSTMNSSDIAGERDLLLLRHATLLGIARDLAGERTAEAGKVGAAVALRDGVGEAQHRLVVAVVPGERRLDRDALARGLDHDRLRDEWRLVA